LFVGLSDRITKLRNSIIPFVQNINYDANNFFIVGEKICSYYIDLSKPTNKIEVCKNDKIYNLDKNKDGYTLLTEDEKIMYSIFEKVDSSSLPIINYYSNYNNTDGSSTPKFLEDDGIISKDKSSKFNKKFVHSCANIFWTSKSFENYEKIKVFVPFSSSYKNMIVDEGVVGKQVEGILVKDHKEGNIVKENLCNKLYDFYVNNKKTGGFNTPIFSLKDFGIYEKKKQSEIYKVFNLSKEEIKLIEKNVK